MRVRGDVVLQDKILEDRVVVVSDGVIADVRAAGPGASGAKGALILPGLIDTHVHGGGGLAFNQGVDAAVEISRHHRCRGSTTVLASLVTDSHPHLLTQVRALAQAVKPGWISGVHLEGPFLSEVRRGAHSSAHLCRPDARRLSELLAAGEGRVRQVTLAPELPGAISAVRQLAHAHVVAAVGHSDADFDAAAEAIDAGATLATHLFNAMRPWRHRGSSIATACLSAAARGRCRLELVADGVHLDPGTVRTVFDLIGPSGIVLVSDATPASGSAAERLRLGPVPVRMEGGVLRVDDGGRTGAIAGSTAHLLDVVRWAHQVAGVPLADAVRSASQTPAELYGMRDRGAIAPGMRADLVVVDKDLQLSRAMVGGSWV